MGMHIDGLDPLAVDDDLASPRRLPLCEGGTAEAASDIGGAHKRGSLAEQFPGVVTLVSPPILPWPDQAARRRSGNSPSSPSREAGQTPRSVTSAVTSRAGVTSKA
jgi:hypothetical protein